MGSGPRAAPAITAPRSTRRPRRSPATSFTAGIPGKGVVDLFDAASAVCTCANSCVRPLAERALHAHYLSLGDWHGWCARRPAPRPADLDLYRDTARPAATALVRLGLTGGQMDRLLMCDVTPDGESIRCDNNVLAVPAELRLILRRQHLASASCGVGPTGPFLTLMGLVLHQASSLVV